MGTEANAIMHRVEYNYVKVENQKEQFALIFHATVTCFSSFMLLNSVLSENCPSKQNTIRSMEFDFLNLFTSCVTVNRVPPFICAAQNSNFVGPILKQRHI